ncbi:hypothetical protein K1T71_013804 [Dendrolimus kikuchii]|uniref:Uncharacterized protein n=1 Tax=Dendrolimus kikuchii TaxID=765133 RepID=A0ACC1CFS5_9NEOP|nr:hypothetical protein K1T71_013804 [Dendrolimus kikuchii]
MLTISLLLILPVIYAKIQVDITASNGDDKLIHLSGSSLHPITDDEKHTFDLTEENLKNAVLRYFGAMPDHAYVKSPTPWGDLYKTFSWNEVHTALKPIRAKMLSSSSEQLLVHKEMMNNTQDQPMKLNTKIEKNLENAVMSFWDMDGELTVNQDIQYNFHFKTNKETEMPFSYTSKWGVETWKMEHITVGSKYPIEIPFEPNQNIMLELQTTKGVMKIQVDYEATLHGSAAVNFSNKKGGHHFWSLDITSLVDAGDLRRSVKSTEVLEVMFHSDAKLVVYDASTMNVLYTKPMDIY